MAREMAHTVWQGLRLTHPSEWEPARLTTDRSHSQCSLVDPYQQRADVHWRPSRATPDLNKIFRKYRSAAGKSVEQQELAGASNWTGFVTREGGQTLTRAGRYFEKQRLLVELSLAWPKARDKTLERRVLAGVRPMREDEPTLVQALGLSFEAPREFALAGYKALAGHLRFDLRGLGGRLLVSRLTLIGGWLKGELHEWMRSEVKGYRIDREPELADVNGHEAVRLLSSCLSVDWRLPLGHRQWREDLAWVCDESDRAYVLRWVRPGRRRRPMPEIRLGCCEPLSQPEAGG